MYQIEDRVQWHITMYILYTVSATDYATCWGIGTRSQLEKYM